MTLFLRSYTYFLINGVENEVILLTVISLNIKENFFFNYNIFIINGKKKLARLLIFINNIRQNFALNNSFIAIWWFILVFKFKILTLQYSVQGLNCLYFDRFFISILYFCHHDICIKNYKSCPTIHIYRSWSNSLRQICLIIRF